MSAFDHPAGAAGDELFEWGVRISEVNACDVRRAEREAVELCFR
jgi:hypothetical protein